MNCQRKEAHNWLFTLAVILEMACVGLLSIQRVTGAKQSGEKCVPVCDTKECVLLANSMLKNIDPKADPCADVSKFMCGSYEDRFAKEEGSCAFFDADLKMHILLNSIISDIKADPDTAVGKMKIVYDSCVDYASLERNALPTAKKFLDEIGIPNWPYLSSDFRFLDTDVPSVLGKLKARGERLFIMPYFQQGPVDMDFFLSNRSDGVPFDWELDPKDSNSTLPRKKNITVRFDTRFFIELDRPFSKESIVYILKYFELNSEEVERIWKDYSDVRESIVKLKDKNCFQREFDCKFGFPWYEYSRLINITSPYYDDRNCSREITINCSNENGNWTDMCKAVEVYLNTSGAQKYLDKDPVIIEPIGEEGFSHFLENIFPVLKSFSDRTVANFLALNFFLDHLEDLNFYFQLTSEKHFRPSCDFTEIVKKPKENRWKYCTKWIATNMMYALQFALKDDYIAVQELEKISGIFQECMSETRDIISRLDDLTFPDIDTSLEMIDLLKFNFGELKEFTSHPKMYEKVINRYFERFHPQKGNFLHNVLEFGRTISDIYKIAVHPIVKLFLSPRFEVQARASIKNRYIDISFGVLRPPFYMQGLQRLLNNLSLASILYHEIGHYLDVNIFRANSKAKECLTNQFSQFKFEFLNETLDGSRYRHENFADLVSTQMMDRRIEKYATSEEAILLPGLPYSVEQILYMIISMHWCMKATEEYELRYKEEWHALDNLRSIGKTQNSQVFPKAFNCLEGSYMNPTQKCTVMTGDL